MNLPPRIALGLLGLSLACQMGNPAFDQASGGETRGNADSLDTQDTLDESNDSNSMGDGDPSTGDGDPTTGDGDPTTGDGDPTTGDGDPTTGDGDPTTGDGDPTTGDGDGDGAQCGDGNIDPNEQCDDANDNNDDSCTNDCKFNEGGDGDGDPDGGMVGLDLMMVAECIAIMNPVTCQQCVETFCCFPPQLDCLESPACMCVVECILNGQNNQQICNNECAAEQSDAALVQPALPCIAENCSDQCSGP